MPKRGQALAVADHFGDNLRRIRKREDLSQEELAKRAALHRTAIGLLEHGERVCRIDTLICLAGAMSVAPGELLDGIHWVVPGPGPKGSFSIGSSSISAIPGQGTEEASEYANRARKRRPARQN